MQSSAGCSAHSCVRITTQPVPMHPSRVMPGQRCAIGVPCRISHPLNGAARRHHHPHPQIGDQQVCAGATGYAASSAPYGGEPSDSSSLRMSDLARLSLERSTRALKRYGWLGFWSQLSVSIISGVILLFSVAFTSQGGPKVSLYLTLVGIVAGFLSTFWNFGYLRTANRLQEYLDGADVARIKKQQVVDMLTRGVLINLLGAGSTLVAVQAMVGTLVAKTLANASVNPFMATAAGAYNPVLALDVFLVQAATNSLLGHFLSLLCSLWLLNVVNGERGLQFQRDVRIQRLKDRRDASGFSTLSGAIVEPPSSPTSSMDGYPPLGGGGGKGGGGGLSSGGAGAGGARWFGGFGNLGGGGGGGGGARRAVGGIAAAAATAGGGGGGGGPAAAASPAGGLTQRAAAARRVAARAAAGAAVLTSAAAATTGRAAAGLRRTGRHGGAGGRAERDFLVLATEQSLANPLMDGSHPGDLGFDPLGLYSADNAGSLLDPRWLSYAEVLHGRWAMLAAAGCLAPEVLARQGVTPSETGVEWFRTGWLPAAGQLPWVDSYPKLCALQAALMAGAEAARVSDYLQPGVVAERLAGLGVAPDVAAAFAAPPAAPGYPGGPAFNPLRIVDSRAAMAQFKTSETKHGRLAMLAMLGYAAQALMTGAGPWRNLQDHLAAPLSANVLTALQHPLGGQ